VLQNHHYFFIQDLMVNRKPGLLAFIMGGRIGGAFAWLQKTTGWDPHAVAFRASRNFLPIHRDADAGDPL